jgi:GTP-binding protein LepA
MEIVQERLEREFDQDLVTTAPSVVYEVELNDGTVLRWRTPARCPTWADPRDPRAHRHGAPLHAAGQRRAGDDAGQPEARRADEHGLPRQAGHLTYELPLAEIVLDFFDKLKSVSRGYASMDYEFKEYRAADVVKVDMLINGDRRSTRWPSSCTGTQSQYRGRAVAAKMRELIPRQMYDVAIQASIGANIIAREDMKALRKNVLAKCYGGDITRKRKLLEKQKAGKKRMKQIGTVEVPQEAFLAILQVEE